MLVRNQVIKDGDVVLDTVLQSRTDYAALHSLLKFHGVQYDPAQFKTRQGWVQFKDGDWVYRTMKSSKFGA